jgi:hypothetical protein
LSGETRAANEMHRTEPACYCMDMSRAEKSDAVAAEMTRDRKRQLTRLARLMNRQGGRWLPVTAELLDCIAVAIPYREADFLLKTGGRTMSAAALADLSGLPAEAFDTSSPIF